MDPRSNGAESLQHALVSYLPSRLGRFLDQLRIQLVPECQPRAHVTLLPPRLLPGSEQEAWLWIQDYCRKLSAFELEITRVAVFELSSVVYLELGVGRDALIRIHEDLNVGPLYFNEPYRYHPHITLAQDLIAGQVEEKAAEAHRLWAGMRFPRFFPVEELVFVRSTGNNRWVDLGSIQLQKTPAATLF